MAGTHIKISKNSDLQDIFKERLFLQLGMYLYTNWKQVNKI